MDNTRETDRDSGRNAWCSNCGRALISGARFCEHCGAQIRSIESTEQPRIAAAMTLAWVLSTLSWLFVADLIPSDGWAIYLWLLLMIPAMVVYLVPYAFVIVQAVYRFGPGHYPPLGPGLQGLATGAWAFVCLLYTSEPLVEPFTAMPLLFFGIALLVSWVLFIIPAAWGAWKRRRFKRIQLIAGYLLPLPVAIVLLVVGSSYSLRVRFELSEGALHDQVQHFERGDLPTTADSDIVGLYTVEHIDRRYGCIVLQTNSGIDMAGGFAYCTNGGPPTGDFVRADHLKNNWWKYAYDSNGPR